MASQLKVNKLHCPMPRCFRSLGIATLSLVASIGTAKAEISDVFTEGEKLFALKVMPTLADKCFSCHGEDPEEIEGDWDERDNGDGRDQRRAPRFRREHRRCLCPR